MARPDEDGLIARYFAPLAGPGADGLRDDAATLSPRYRRHADFVDLVARLDPRGAFRNSWFERHVLGS